MARANAPRIYLQAFQFSATLIHKPRRRDAAIEAEMRLGGSKENLRFPLFSLKSLTGARAMISIGYAEHEILLASRLRVYAPLKRGALLVQLLAHDGTPDRTFILRFNGWEWLPFDLVAASEEVAKERVLLRNVSYVNL